MEGGVPPPSSQSYGEEAEPAVHPILLKKKLRIILGHLNFEYDWVFGED